MFEFLLFTNKRILYWLFLVVILLPSVISKDNTKRCIEKERRALLYVNPACTYVNTTFWDPNDDCCNWPGVYCSNHTGRVYHLHLSSFLEEFCEQVSLDSALRLNSSLLALKDLVDLDFSSYYPFVGTLPAFLGSFRNLRYLDLSYTPFTGLIPLQIGNLTRLQSLNIAQDYNDGSPGVLHVENLKWLSQLTLLKSLVLSNVNLVHAGDWIHVVNNLPSLTYLDLHDTRVPNSIPSRLLVSNFSKSLSYVDLSANNLEASSSWTWLFNHSSIATLYLSRSQLSGPISKYTRGPCKLQIMDLSHNNLTGNLVSFLQSLSCAQNSLTSLSLQHNQLSGSVPDITVFPFLRKLLLHKNNLDGSLPSTFKAVSDLVVLNLQANKLTGSVPDLSVFKSLKTLHLQHNHLNGSIHLGLGQLSNLVTLDFSSNSLKDQIVAGHFSNLSRLRYLDMSFNSLRFNISSDWIPPFRLETIGLASCKLGPYFPKWLQTQIDYSELDVFNASISDNIPSWFWNVSSRATFIGLSYNKLRGVLPNSSIVFDYYPAVDLSFNILDGPIPSFLSNVQYLNLSRNSFSGSISFLCKCKWQVFMFGLDLSYNHLSGKLPNCFISRDYFSIIDFSNNNFSGELPSSLSSPNLLSLHLRNNRFSGNLPLSLRNATDLIYLDLGGNLFSGELPTWIGHSLSNLIVLSLENNSFSGIISSHLCQLSSLQILDLSMNNISGKIPNCLCNLKAMSSKESGPVTLISSNGTFSNIGLPHKDHISLVWKGLMYEYSNTLNLVKIIDLSSNKLEGGIPSQVSCLTGLLSLNLSRNGLTGSITSKIGQLRELESLDLSNNRLSGNIPVNLSTLNFLSTLDLANNNLSGKIPVGIQIQSLNATMFEGNPGLCGDPLPNKCAGDENNKDDDGDESNFQTSGDGNEVVGLYISIALGFITGFWLVSGTLVMKKSWRHAYFRFWVRVYDRIFVFIVVRMTALQRRFQV